jgi:parallel beta-helix repeat protein
MNPIRSECQEKLLPFTPPKGEIYFERDRPRFQSSWHLRSIILFGFGLSVWQATGGQRSLAPPVTTASSGGNATTPSAAPANLSGSPLVATGNQSVASIITAPGFIGPVTGTASGDLPLRNASLRTMTGLPALAYPASVAPESTLTTDIIAGICNGTTPGIVTLPLGTVNFSTTLTVPSHCTIRGAGLGVSVLLLAANTTLGTCGASTAKCAITNSQAPLHEPSTADTSIRLQDFTLNLNNANQTIAAYGVLMGNLNHSSMDRLEVNGGDVYFGETNATVVGDAGYTRDLTISDSHFHNARISPSQDQDSLGIMGVNVWVTGNTLGPSSDSGLGLMGYGTAFITVVNNTFTNNAQACSLAAGPAVGSASTITSTNSHVTFTGNTISCNRGNPYGTVIVGGTDIAIVSNRYSMTPAPGSQVVPNIMLESASYSTVTGNVIHGGKDAGIALENYNNDLSRGDTISANSITRMNNSGIELLVQAATGDSAFLSNISVTANSIIEPGNCTAAVPGIYLSQSASGDATQLMTGSVQGNVITDDCEPARVNYGVMGIGTLQVVVSGNKVTGATASAYRGGDNRPMEKQTLRKTGILHPQS